MCRSISIITMLFFSYAASAQSNSMSKTSISNTENSVVEITAPAIPIDRMHQVEIDPANYHIAVNLGDSLHAPVQEINISTSAVKYNNSIISTVRKEVQSPAAKGSSSGKQKMVEVNAPAIRR